MRGMRSLVAILAGGLTAVAVTVGLAWTAPPPAGWADPTAHVVDGYWVTAETPCIDATSDCRVAIQAALDLVRAVEPEVQVDRAVMTSRASGYMDRAGQARIDFTTSGLVRSVLVVVETDDGRRRLIGLRCSPVPISLEEPIRLETECRPHGVDAHRTGAEPWLLARP